MKGLEAGELVEEEGCKAQDRKREGTKVSDIVWWFLVQAAHFRLPGEP